MSEELQVTTAKPEGGAAREGSLIVERTLHARSRESGQQITIKVSIDRPYWTEEGVEAACPVTFEGVYGRQPDIRGIDPLDALRNALALTDKLIDGAQRDYELFWPDGEPFENS